MNIALSIALAMVFIAIVVATILVSGLWKLIPILLGLGLVTFFAVFFHSWWFVIWAGALALAVYLLLVIPSLFWKIALGILALVVIVGGVFITTPLIKFQENPGSVACQPANNLNLTTGGEVENNLDDGDGVMGTIVMVTRDNPTKDPVLVIVMPGASIDVEYEGKMYFTTDRFAGSLSEAVCLADSLHKGITNKIVIGATEALPEGWRKLKDVDGWWVASTWLYKETPIQPQGLTASEGIFISTDQTKRDIVTKEGEVVYGQFWQPPYAGSVVHIQVRSKEVLTVPKGWEGTYWVWTGDFKVGERELQKRMLQATFTEVVNRDEISSVTLLACGQLPQNLDQSLFTFKFKGQDLVWASWLEGWDCKAK